MLGSEGETKEGHLGEDTEPTKSYLAVSGSKRGVPDTSANNQIHLALSLSLLSPSSLFSVFLLIFSLLWKNIHNMKFATLNIFKCTAQSRIKNIHIGLPWRRSG